MLTPPGRQVLRFQAGGVPFALPLSAVREIVPAVPGGPRGVPDGAVDLAAVLGLRGPVLLVLLLDGPGPPALLVERLDGVSDLAGSEAFRLPEGTVAARPSPFSSALLFGEVLHLELVPGALGSLRADPPRALPEAADLPAAGRELLAVRAGQTFAVPLPLVVQVIDPVRLSPVPMAPRGLRGLLHHGRAIHPAWDAAVLLGGEPEGAPRVLLLVDAGGATAGVLVDRVLGLSEGEGGGPVRRPPWDVLLAPPKGPRNAEED